MLVDYVRSMRIKHWYKALIVLAGPVFSGYLFSLDLLGLLLTFFAFCFIASSIYVLNDVVDKEKDLQHPKKKNRPIASGRISTSRAVFFSAILFAVATVMAAAVNPAVLATVLGYAVLMFAYIFVLKNIAVVDAFVLAVGYVLRAFAGCYATGIRITNRFYLAVFSFAVYLAFCKRLTEIRLSGNEH